MGGPTADAFARCNAQASGVEFCNDVLNGVT
jgi:hypothetical protein